jgi:hypothetical protein
VQPGLRDFRGRLDRLDPKGRSVPRVRRERREIPATLVLRVRRENRVSRDLREK